MTKQVGHIEIECETTLAPEVCVFKVDRAIHDGDDVRFTNAEMAAGSPLMEKLFAIAGIREVLIAGDSLTVAKDESVEWSLIGPQIGEAIRAALASGEPLISSATNSAPATEQQIREKIQALFDSEINPAIKAHGGEVAIAEIKIGRAHV